MRFEDIAATLLEISLFLERRGSERIDLSYYTAVYADSRLFNITDIVREINKLSDLQLAILGLDQRPVTFNSLFRKEK